MENKLLTKQTVVQTLTKVELGSGGVYFCVTGDMGGTRGGDKWLSNLIAICWEFYTETHVI